MTVPVRIPFASELAVNLQYQIASKPLTGYKDADIKRKNEGLTEKIINVYKPAFSLKASREGIELVLKEQQCDGVGWIQLGSGLLCSKEPSGL
jgi:hypothetical protein